MKGQEQATGRTLGVELGSGQAVRLIATRELKARLASKAYRITTAAFVIVVVAGGVLLHLIGATAGTKHIAVTSGASGVAAQLEQTAQGLGISLQTQDVPNAAAGAALVRSGDVDAVVVTTSPRLGVIVKQQLDPALDPLFRSLAQQLALAHAVTALGGDPTQVAQGISQAAPDVTPLQPAAAVDTAQVIAGTLTGILLFLALMTTGQLVAQGVVEEKSSRVVELLLAAVRPWQLMAGKVTGIGLVGLLQVVLVVGAGVGTALWLGLLHASSLALGTTAVWAIVWFLIGFASYALVFAALASLVSRQEDVASVVGPVTAVMVVPYIIGISVATSAPDNPLVAWLSYIPFCAPLIMPIRIALGAVDGWQAVISAAISIAAIPVLVWLAGRIYSTAVIHTGSRVRFLEALRGS